MYKNIITMIFYSIIVFVCMFFMNGDVKAMPISNVLALGSSSKPLYGDDKVSVNCSCYYTGEYVQDNRVTYYAVEMVYGAKTANVKSICETDERKNVFSGGKCKKVDNPTRGNPFEVDSKAIYDKKCSVAACNSAKIYFYSSAGSTNNRNILDILLSGSKEIVTGGYNCDGGFCVAAPLTAYSKEQYNKVTTADNMQQSMVDEGMVADHFNSDGNNIEKIQCWANPSLEFCGSSDTTNRTCQFLDGKYYGKNGDVVDEKAYTKECYTGNCNLISTDILDFLKNFLFIIQIIGILLLIGMSLVEFMKAITGSDDDSLRNAIKNTGKRIIVVVILLLLPVIIVGTLNIVNDSGFQKDDDGHYIIGEDGNPLCNLDK